MNKSLSRYAAAVTLVIGVQGLAQAQPTYSVTPILPEVSEVPGVVLAGFVSNDGAVLGRASEGTFDEDVPLRTFLWNSGQTTYLNDREPDFLSDITDFNNAGQIAGSARRDSSLHAAIWTDGELEFLEELPDENPISRVRGMNDLGDAVGTSNIGASAPGELFNPGTPLPVAWVGGSVSQLETLPDAREGSTLPEDINNAGMIIGLTRVPAGDQETSTWVRRGLVWQDGQVEDIGSFVPGGRTLVADLNDNGQVIGTSEYTLSDGETVTKGFIWQHGAMEPLGPLESSADIEPLAINNEGHVVGAIVNDGSPTPFLWTPESGMVDLSTLISPEELGENDRLVAGVGINDHGQIIVGGEGSDRSSTSYLLTPRDKQRGDSDGDGVPDSEDNCAMTGAGQVVNSDGCSIAQLVPCDGPADGGQWRNSWAYLSVLRHEASVFVSDGLISQWELVELLRDGRRAGCGRWSWSNR